MTMCGSPTFSNAMAESSPVTVNVYDMSWLNEYIGNIGLGVYHTGVEVYEREYCYGGHQFGSSGIFEMTPRDTESLGPNYSFKTSIVVGFTDFTYRDVCTIISNMERDFRGAHYHLLRKNCNHFSSAFVEILCGATLPKWINRLAVVSTKLPFIEKSIPKEWLTPPQQNDEDTVESSHRVHHHQAYSLRRSNTPSVASLPPTPNRSNTAPPASISPGEQWRRFQSQVSNYFKHSVGGGGGNGGGGSSSTSVSTPPPTEKSSSRRHS
ncbi:Desumoylating isopeptidase 2 [Echinococcus granulosus]|uniref:PPPDE peptidase domain containing protein 1 n=2 Tax=Echinococcus TaxID=6209 RepID=A0A068X254_ECHGR|nr:Desumoylating isopeptidase 2 [Echinococcus granulosus]CDS24073.1 PPPDE peptidase domain containing protein 1 [Echinococcus granulosus]CDS36647.1 PPPDE peptidase domain containing protein 1 [Echinococcus multilocularis]